jgi:mono/diheme cytochrome c family protein
MNTLPPEEPPRPLPPPFREAPPVDVAKAAVENVLLANCGYCHSSVLTPAQAQDGINYINDVDKLVEAGLIDPLSSLTSRIISVMRSGKEPPASSGYPRMTDADIDLVASYIDNPRYWPGSYMADSADAGVAAPSVDAGADGG